MGNFRTIDPGITTFDEFGRPRLSAQAIRIPAPPDIGPAQPKTFENPLGFTPQQMPAPMQGNSPQNVAPTPQMQGQQNLPKTSIPSERYQEIEAQAPQRDDPRFQQHGLAKLGNIIASLTGGIAAPLVYNKLKQIPFERAQQDWATRLSTIKPEVQHQETEMQERGIQTRHADVQSGLNKYRDEETAHRKAQEAETDRLRQVEEDRAREAERKNTMVEREREIEAKERERHNRATEEKERKPSDTARAWELYTKRASGEVLSPKEEAELKGYKDLTFDTKTAPGIARMEVVGQNREYPVIDTANQNSPQFLSATEINAANKREPGRFMPAGVATQALKPAALLGDIRGNINQVRQALNALPEDFGKLDRAKIAFALRSNDPRGAISQFLSGESAAHLTPAQQEYIISVSNLIENSLSMRQLLGVGQGSRDLRAAIEAVIPGPMTPSKSFASRQLDYFEKTLARLEAGIPKVPLRTDTGIPANKPKGKIISQEDDK